MPARYAHWSPARNDSFAACRICVAVLRVLRRDVGGACE